MPTLNVYVTEETYARLSLAAREAGRTSDDIETFAESAVEEAALAATRHIPREDLLRRKKDGKNAHPKS